MAIRCWIEEEKKKTVNDEDGEEENQDIHDSDFIINNSNHNYCHKQKLRQIRKTKEKRQAKKEKGRESESVS